MPANLIVYFILTFLISWGIWVPLALTGGSDQALLWLAGFGPTLAAVIVTGWKHGRAGLKQLLSGVVRLRVKPVWYLVSLLGAPVVFAAALGLHVVLGGAAPHLVDPNHMLTEPGQWPLAALVFGYIFVFTALGEEIGWRGFALPVLQSRFSGFASSLVLGVIWTLWHLPLFWFVDGFHQQLPFGWYALQIIGSTFLYTWMFNRTRGSLLIMMLFHTASNAAVGLLPVLPLDNGGSFRPLWLVVGLLWLAAFAALWFDRRTFWPQCNADRHTSA